MKITERYDMEAAAQNARTQPRPSGCLPHWLRCDWCKGDWDTPGPKLRCRLADNHQGPHEYGE